MNLACLDSHYFIWGLYQRSEAVQKEKIPAAIEFFRYLDESDITIIVPTPLVTELLMKASPAEQMQLLDALEKKFRVAEYDVNSARLAAEIWNAKKASGEADKLYPPHTGLRTKLKIDVQILAIAINAGAAVLYTQDEPFATLAKGYLVTRKMPEAVQGTLWSLLEPTATPKTPQTPTVPVPEEPPQTSNEEAKGDKA